MKEAWYFTLALRVLQDQVEADFAKLQQKRLKVDEKEAAKAAPKGRKPRAKTLPAPAPNSDDDALESHGGPSSAKGAGKGEGKGAGRGRGRGKKSAEPATPSPVKRKISASLQACTPRCNNMLQRTRANAVAPAAVTDKVALALQNLRALRDSSMKVPEIGEKKSFTVQPPGVGNAIGVILSTSTFYIKVKKESVKELEKLQFHVPEIKLDIKGGCSLGWRRFDHLAEAWLAFSRVRLHS